MYIIQYNILYMYIYFFNQPHICSVGQYDPTKSGVQYTAAYTSADW